MPRKKEKAKKTQLDLLTDESSDKDDPKAVDTRDKRKYYLENKEKNKHEKNKKRR